ncbi:MAG: DbpA RNA binding domain-containing protein [Sphaerochaetaceae bacterium]|nr:DbpA RNA binding domain-containing protein [Sphaerochaetaceae bacterium]
MRVHDKYSFVTLPEQFAEQAIAKLNGMEIKGRVASVTYSNKE